MHGTKIKTLKDGTIITVDERGLFMAWLSEQDVEPYKQHGSMTILLEMIEAAQKRERVKISVSYTDAKTGRDVEITGKHATTGRWLARVYNEKLQKVETVQLDRYSYADRGKLKVLSSEQRKELNELRSAVDRAQRNYEDFLTTHQFGGVGELAKREWDKACAAAEAAASAAREAESLARRGDKGEGEVK
jgi:hypothetical protein